MIMRQDTVQQTPAHRSRALHVTLWIVQLLLAAFFLMAGVNHGFKPIAEAAQSSPWITPWLTPLAAAGLAVIMVLAIPFHVMRGEASVIAFNIVPALLAAFVA